MGKKWKQWQILYSWEPKLLQVMIAAMKLRCLLLGRKAMTSQDSVLKSRNITLPTKFCMVKARVFSSNHVWMWELDHKKAEHQGIDAFECVVLEKKLESPLDCKVIKPVNPKGNSLWKFLEKTNSEAEVPILWPPDVKSWLTGDPDTGKHWEQEEKGALEDEMVWWHHWLNGPEAEQAPGDSKGHGSLACCSPWGCK